MANGFETFLSKVGKDFKAVFSWLSSPTGKAVVAGAETAAVGVATAVNPGVGAVVNGVVGLVNTGLSEAINVETVAAAAGQQAGTGAQKAAAVVNAVAPQVGALLTAFGVSSPTAEEVQNLSTVVATASANILNAIPARATIVAPAS